MSKDKKILLIRNVRSNWSAYLIFEYFKRNQVDSKFGYVNLISKEVFPPNKPAPIFISAHYREIFISTIFFRNPLPSILTKILIKNMNQYKKRKASLKDLILVAKLCNLNSYSKLKKFSYCNIPYGQFIATPMIAKYGIKHFEISKLQNLSNILLFFRFIISFRTINQILERENFSHVLFINGRDVVGSAAQLSAYIQKINVISLEGGQGIFNIPKFGEWQGNMHHWKVTQEALNQTFSQNRKNFTVADARKYFRIRYGLNSKWWKMRDLNLKNDKSINGKYICFFTSSEDETTTSPVGIKGLSDFDTYDQSTILEQVYKIARSHKIKLVVRLHPTYSNDLRRSTRIDGYFQNLTKNWKDVVIIGSTEQTNSYKLAEKAWVNFVFRSTTLASELSILNIPVYVTAQTENSNHAINQQTQTSAKIEDVIVSPQKLRHNATEGFHSYACYAEKFGTSFSYIKIIKSKNSGELKSKFEFWYEGSRLDIPRFGIKQFRA